MKEFIGQVRGIVTRTGPESASEPTRLGPEHSSNQNVSFVRKIARIVMRSDPIFASPEQREAYGWDTAETSADDGTATSEQ